MSGVPNTLSADTIYAELNERLRSTDEISFKLLGFVPLVSGAAFAAVLLKSGSAFPPGIFYLSALGVLITLCLFGWELRNLKTCNHLCNRIDGFPGAEPTFENEAPRLFGDAGRIGKTQMEKVLYTVLTLSWIALPYAVCEISGDGVDDRLNCLNVPVVWLMITAVAILILPLYWLADVRSSETSGLDNE